MELCGPGGVAEMTVQSKIDGDVLTGGGGPNNTQTDLDGVWQTTQLDTAIGQICVAGSGAPLPSVVVTGDPVSKENLEARSVRPSAKKKRRVPKPRIVPSVRIYIGTFVHALPDRPLELLKKWMIGVDGGRIIFSRSIEDLKAVVEKYKLKEFEKECIFFMTDWAFMMPGFVNCHTHVVPYMMSGLGDRFRTRDRAENQVMGQDGGIAKDMQERRSRALSLISNDKTAQQLFSSFVAMSLMNGITCASYNGSLVESASRLLTDTVVRFKQRAFIGLEIFYGDNRDDTHLLQIIKAKDVAHHVLRRQNERVKPHLVLSSPLPDWLEKKVVDIGLELDIPIKTVLADKSDTDLHVRLGDWVPMEKLTTLRYHKKHGLLNSKSLLVQCSQCSDRDIKIIADADASVIYCPNADLVSGAFPNNVLAKLVKRHIKIGLGTDVVNSQNVSMLEVIRSCLLALNLGRTWPQPPPPPPKITIKNEPQMIVDKLEFVNVPNGEKNEDEDSDDNDDDGGNFDASKDSAQLTYKDLFQMATLGGAIALGLDEKIGNFDVGKDFDALYIQTRLQRSNFFITNFDTVEEAVEKFIMLGDDRNISQVFIAGESLF